ncbi:MAG: fused MFS/spermidine synthase [Roseiflexus sp.]
MVAESTQSRLASYTAALAARLERLRLLPDGIICDLPLPQVRLWVIKEGTFISLFFLNPESGALDGPMSRIDLDHPLHLLAPYTRTLLLTLLWRPSPRRVCMLGFGGGRISLVLHAHLPNVIIDNVDIDPAFETVAATYFGVIFDERQRFLIADAQEYLQQSPYCYDIIFMDAFSDARDNLDHLATADFYALCRQRLLPGGVVGINMLRSDPRFVAKAQIFRASFRTKLAVPLRHSLVLFGADRMPAPRTMIGARAHDLAFQYGFDADLSDIAATLRPLRDLR